MNRGDIYWVDLEPTKGSEIRKKRPCVLVGATPINKARKTVVVVPLSTAAKIHPPITIGVKCLQQKVAAICDQIRTVDKSRLTNQADVLSEKDLKALDEGLRSTLCL
ncbi:MAG: PemK family transcriptional regulator [Legionellales bacterium]|nr:PemK family transcriptional regulator [Legionellales bacterium]|tara:strand:- start:858 stop:1178 length:321 start_codon:yes stop_codon:yes gene_type:complete